jgi:hypothetical protein
MQNLSTAAAAVFLSLAFSAAHATDAVQVPAKVQYAADNDIAGAIKRECPLGDQLADFIIDYAKDEHVEVKRVDKTDATMPGRVLVVEITDSISRGNAFLGHHKATRVRGALYQDGQKIGSFTGERDSMGGAFAGFKGSCSVLGRTVKALGSDIAQWLSAPSDGAQLGDLR